MTTYADSFSNAPAGRVLDALLVKELTPWGVVWIDTGFGLDAFAYDTKATREGPVHMLGGAWTKGRNAQGELVEVFGRQVPAYSDNWRGLGELQTLMQSLGFTLELVCYPRLGDAEGPVSVTEWCRSDVSTPRTWKPTAPHAAAIAALRVAKALREKDLPLQLPPVEGNGDQS